MPAFSGSVSSYIHDRLKSGKKLLAVLVDPANFSKKKAGDIVMRCERAGASLVLVGGSTVSDQRSFDSFVAYLRGHVSLPVVIFPNNVTSISRYANAILFMSLVNSTNPYYIFGAQVLGAPLIMKYGLETLPTAYIVVGERSSVSFMGYVNPIPMDKPEITSLYSLASWYMGMKYLYLEAGSGSEQPVPSKMVRKVREVYPGVIFVGGGVRSAEKAKEFAEAGADIIVVGNLLEQVGFEKTLSEITESLRQ